MDSPYIITGVAILIFGIPFIVRQIKARQQGKSGFDIKPDYLQAKNYMTYDDYVIRSILANNQFGITVVNDLQNLKSLSFVREEFHVIERLIKSNDITAIQSFSQNRTGTNGTRMREYLDIMSFIDQSGEFYIVAIYDSDALEQDPQVIEVYYPNGSCKRS